MRIAFRSVSTDPVHHDGRVIIIRIFADNKIVVGIFLERVLAEGIAQVNLRSRVSLAGLDVEYTSGIIRLQPDRIIHFRFFIRKLCCFIKVYIKLADFLLSAYGEGHGVARRDRFVRSVRQIDLF